MGVRWWHQFHRNVRFLQSLSWCVLLRLVRKAELLVVAAWLLWDSRGAWTLISIQMAVGRLLPGDLASLSVVETYLYESSLSIEQLLMLMLRITSMVGLDEEVMIIALSLLEKLLLLFYVVLWCCGSNADWRWLLSVGFWFFSLPLLFCLIQIQRKISLYLSRQVSKWRIIDLVQVVIPM